MVRGATLAKQLTAKKPIANLDTALRTIAVIPAYNVEDTVKKIVKETQKFVDQVIIVNDGSRDNTLSLVDGFSVEIVNHKKNRGLGRALRHGFQVALTHGFDVVITLDSDGQHDAKDIKRLVDKLVNTEADAVIGSRLLDKKEWKNFPRKRLLGNRILTYLTNGAVGRKVTTDSQSGFRVIRTARLKHLDLKESQMAISSEIIYELAKRNLKIEEVPIKATYDKEISNVRAIRDISRILWVLLKKRLSS